MFELDSIIDILMENIKKISSIGDWVELDLKFSKSEIFTLLYLDRKKEVTMTELVEYIGSPMSTATGIADRLVRNGYISRERSEADRRVVILTLTEKGSQLINNLKAMLQGYITRAVEGLSEAEVQTLLGIVLKILGNLQKELNTDAPGGQDKDVIKSIEIE